MLGFRFFGKRLGFRFLGVFRVWGLGCVCGLGFGEVRL